MSGPLDVFGLGQCSYDRYALVDALPLPDQKAEYEPAGEGCGGPVATALVALTRWGRRCSFAGVVGDDDEGERIRADLEAEGVETKHTRTRAGTRTQAALVTVERGTGRRTILWHRPTGAEPGAEEIDPQRAPIFLTDGLFEVASIELARRAERVVVDAGTVRPGTLGLIPHAEVFVASESFARAFVGSDAPKEACRKLRDAGVAVAGVTLGERGYVALAGDSWIEGPAQPAAVVDTTGCGDLFHAGLVEGMLAGSPWPECFEFAAWAAARVSEALGGRAGIPDRGANSQWRDSR
ncbi:MAG: PfkB family carbohydrate kinase [Planctomycetota bacterium]